MAESDSSVPQVLICVECKIEKLLSEFHKTPAGKYGCRRVCKSCANAKTYEKKRVERDKDPLEFARKQREYNLAWQAANSEKARVLRGAYKKQNAESLKVANKVWYEANHQKILEKKKVYRDANTDMATKAHSDWRENNRAHVNGYWRKYNRDRLQTDVLFSLTKRTRHFICMAILNMGYTKKSKSTEILGCDWVAFKQHIESQFTTDMGWENRNLWHIDHKIPLASAKTEEELLALNHYTNLRPLWAVDNLKKGARLDYPI